jgi:hypothetical protein
MRRVSWDGCDGDDEETLCNVIEGDRGIRSVGNSAAARLSFRGRLPLIDGAGYLTLSPTVGCEDSMRGSRR